MPAPEHELPRRDDVISFAKYLAKEETQRQIEEGPVIAREILQRGGIRSYRGKYLAEEYKEIPLFLKNRSGLPLDEIASEMGLDEASLISMIQKAYPKGKTIRRFNWKDFYGIAYETLRREKAQT